MIGIEALLYDVKIGPLTKTIASDSTSALCISSGTGSWRTRHLRLKAGWVQEMLQAGALTVRHQPGVTQPADMLTKSVGVTALEGFDGTMGNGREVWACSSSHTWPTSTTLHQGDHGLGMLHDDANRGGE